jgi:uncharacterized phage-associated protein
MKVNKNLIGNILILLANNCRPLYLTKALKLLYLIDEEAVKKTGAPITWLSYNVWKFGPVTEDVFYSKSAGQNKFANFVRFESSSENKYIIKATAEFENSEFTKMDLEIIHYVIDQYGHLNSQELVRIVHKKGSLWYDTKEKNNIVFTKENSTSDIELNFAELLNNDGFKKTAFYCTLENIELQSTL